MMGPSEYEVTKGGIIFHLWVAALAVWFTIFNIQLAMEAGKVLYVSVPAFIALAVYGVVQSIRCLVAVIKHDRTLKKMWERGEL